MTRGRPAQDVTYRIRNNPQLHYPCLTHLTPTAHTRYKPPYPYFDPSPRLQPVGPMCIVLCRLDKLSKPSSKRLTAAVTIYIHSIFKHIVYYDNISKDSHADFLQLFSEIMSISIAIIIIVVVVVIVVIIIIIIIIIIDVVIGPYYYTRFAKIRLRIRSYYTYTISIYIVISLLFRLSCVPSAAFKFNRSNAIL